MVRLGKIIMTSAIIPFIIGLYKLLVYDNRESYGENAINAYVGVDAYNYIIKPPLH